MLARVFPRKTTATPDDEYTFFGNPPDDISDIYEAHISVTFSGDIEKAKRLADSWDKVANVSIGGPALDDHGGEFIPGRYIKKGYVFTSRGCPNNCWFCKVNKREGDIRELPITQGWNLLDSNILACSEDHIRSVFDMLGNQEKRYEVTGGFEAARLEPWHVEMLWNNRPRQMFFAYDSLEDLEPLQRAGKMLRYADFTRFHLQCHVLIGQPKDTFTEAESRLLQAWGAGFMPRAMLWMDDKGSVRNDWKQFQRKWFRPPATRNVVKEFGLPVDIFGAIEKE